MSDKKYKHQRAIEVLVSELNKLGGIVFARYIVNTNEKARTSVESMEFLEQLMNGKLKDKDEAFLEPYLKPLWEINTAIELLQKEGFEEVTSSPTQRS